MFKILGEVVTPFSDDCSKLLPTSAMTFATLEFGQTAITKKLTTDRAPLNQYIAFGFAILADTSQVNTHPMKKPKGQNKSRKYIARFLFSKDKFSETNSGIITSNGLNPKPDINRRNTNHHILSIVAVDTIDANPKINRPTKIKCLFSILEDSLSLIVIPT